MAVVKKYAKGNTFEDYIDKIIESKKFGKTPPKEILDAATYFNKLSKLPNAKEVYTYDKINNTYTIDTSKLPEDLKEYNWEGNTEAVKPNLFGKYKSLSNVQANTVVASLFNNYLGNNPEAAATTPAKKEDRDIANIWDYTKKIKYNNADDTLLAKIFKESPDKEALIRATAVETADHYLKEFEQNKNLHNYLNVDKVQAVKNAALSGDYNTFKDAAQKLGWDISKDFDEITKPVVTPLTDAELTEQKLKEQKEGLAAKGITDPAVQEALINSGFTQVNPNYDPSGEGWLPKYLADQKAIVVQNAEGLTKILKGKETFGSYQFDRSDDNRVGHYWNQDANQNVDYFWPKREGWDSSRYLDPLGGQQGGVQLQTSNLGAFSDRKVFGYPTLQADGTPALDRTGAPDYTKHILLEKEGMKPIELFWDNGKYTTSEGEELPNFKVFNYDKNTDVFNLDAYTGGEGDRFKEVEAKQHFDPNQLYSTLEEIKKGGYGSDDIPKTKAVLEDLKYKIQNSKSIAEKKIAMKLYKELTALTADNKYRVLNYKPAAKVDPTIQKAASRALMDFNRKGGVIKGAKGILVKKDEALPNIDIKNNVGRLRDIANDPLAVASLSGTALSVIPGVGAIGGLVTTVADAVKDKRDTGEVNMGTLAMNLGFTGLSLVGLGALKALKVAKLGAVGKTINTVKATANLGKAAKLGVEVGKYDEALKLVDEAADLAGVVSKEGIQVSKILPQLESVALKSGKSVDEILGSVSDIQNLKTSFFTMPNISDKLAKTVKVGTYGAVGTSAGKSLLSAVGDTKEGGLGSIKVDDAGSILAGGALGINALKEIRQVKALKKMSVPAKETPQTYKATIDDNGVSKEITLETIPSKGVKNPINYKEDDLKKLDKLLADEGISDKTREEFLSKFKKEGKKLFTFTPESKEGLVLKTDIVGDVKNLSEYKRAKKALETNSDLPGLPIWMRNFAKKSSNKAASKEASEKIEDISDMSTFMLKNGGMIPMLKKGDKNKKNIPMQIITSDSANVYKDGIIRPSVYDPATKEFSAIMGDIAQIDVFGNNVNSGIKSKFPTANESSIITKKVLPTRAYNPEDYSAELKSLNSVTPTLATKKNQEPKLAIRSTPKFAAPEKADASGYANKDNKPDEKPKGYSNIWDKVPIGEISTLASYFAKIKGNKEAFDALSRMEAVKNSGISPKFKRLSSNANIPYDLQAARTTSTGSRIANTTSDLLAGLAIKLSAENKAGELRLSGDAAARAQLEDIRNYNVSEDARTSGYNNQIENSNKQAQNALDNNKLQQLALLKITNAESANNLIKTLGMYGEQKQAIQSANSKRNWAEKYLQSPEILAATKEYESILPEEKAKELFEKTKSIHDKTTWEDSNAREKYLEDIKSKQKVYQDLLEPVRKLQYAKSGGTLAEKKYLEELKQFHRKELLAIKQLYKSMQDSKNLISKLK